MFACYWLKPLLETLIVGGLRPSINLEYFFPIPLSILDETFISDIFPGEHPNTQFEMICLPVTTGSRHRKQRCHFWPHCISKLYHSYSGSILTSDQTCSLISLQNPVFAPSPASLDSITHLYQIRNTNLVRFLSIIYSMSAIHNSLVENFAGEYLARMKWFLKTARIFMRFQVPFLSSAHFHVLSNCIRSFSFMIANVIV